jgi:hypothetical protein
VKNEESHLSSEKEEAGGQLEKEQIVAKMATKDP